MNTKEMAYQYFNDRCLKLSGVHGGEFIDRDDFMAFINSLTSITWFKCEDQKPEIEGGQSKDLLLLNANYGYVGKGRYYKADIERFSVLDKIWTPTHWAYLNYPNEQEDDRYHDDRFDAVIVDIT